MSLSNHVPGIGSVGEYQTSGIPVCGTLAAGETATFKYVTRAVTFSTSDESTTYGGADISFDGGSTSFKFGSIQDDNASANFAHRVEVKCTSITNVNTSGENLNIQFIAELTNIPAGSCPDWVFADLCSIA